MFVYFIESTNKWKSKYIKIGSSKNPEGRLKDLQTGSPLKIRLIGKIKCKNEFHAKQIEKLAHNIFYKQRRHGEWFNLKDNHITQIKSLIMKCAGLEEK